MRPKLYAELPVRLVRQVVFDAAVLIWLWTWWQLGHRVNSTVDSSKGGALKLQTNASNMGTHLSDAGQRLRKVPLVGETLQTPFDKSAEAAHQMSLAGHDMAVGIDDLGNILGYLTAAAPILFALLLWAVVRIPYARRATQAAALRQTAAGADLLALRALHSSPAAALFAVSDRPAADWRHHDAATTKALAALHLRSLGLKPISSTAAAPDSVSDRQQGASTPHGQR